MKRGYERTTIRFWKNEEGLLAKDIAEALDTNAAELFRLHSLLGSLLVQIDPDFVNNLNTLPDFNLLMCSHNFRKKK